MTRLRWVLGGLGVLMASYGAWLLLSRQESSQVLEAAIWLASGVVLHDFVLAPVVLVLVYAGARVVPRPARAPAVAGLVVLGSATIFAIPVLGGFGERPDNPTLLDGDYTAGWLVLGLTLLAVLVAVLVTALVRSRRR